MTRDEFALLVKGMKAVYPSPTFIPDKEAFDVWYGFLQDLTYDLANTAVQKHILSEKFPPTIADIRRAATEVSIPDEMSEMEAWAKVYKAVCNLRFDEPEEEFNRLPELCRMALGSAANLREMATMDTDTVLSVEQSHFMRNYRVARERKKADRLLPISLRGKIERMQMIMAGGQELLEAEA